MHIVAQALQPLDRSLQLLENTEAFHSLFNLKSCRLTSLVIR